MGHSGEGQGLELKQAGVAPVRPFGESIAEHENESLRRKKQTAAQQQ
jgi:hypothetical protein